MGAFDESRRHRRACRAVRQARAQARAQAKDRGKGLRGETYAQQRMLEAKKRALKASSPHARYRAERWAIAWGNLLRQFR